jgi:hypothetical protein
LGLSHHLLNALLQIENKLGLLKKKELGLSHHLLNVLLQITNKLGLLKKNKKKELGQFSFLVISGSADKLHNEELHVLYCLLLTALTKKLRTMR